MKTLFFTIGLFICAVVIAQPSLTKGGGVEKQRHDNMPETTRMYYWQRNIRNQQKLLREGKLKTQNRGTHPLYAFPLQNNTLDAGFYGISNYVDMNAAFPNQIQDFNCGTRTYDLNSGYNHQGIDFFTFPYGWDKMDNNQVSVHAVASGIIIDKTDNNPDRSCSFNVTTDWNYISVRHADGSYVWYGHMKAGSLTTKIVGNSVNEGEFLGIVGSSGISTGPHLHLETHTVTDQLIEPFTGACNSLNTDTWWQSQENYYNSKIVKIATHSQPPNPYPSCPTTTDITHYQDNFTTPVTIYLARYYRDQLPNQNSHMKVYKPNGAVFAEWDHAPNGFGHYASSYWYNQIDLSAGNASYSGQWTFETTYEGLTTLHKFNVDIIDVIYANGFE